MKTVQVFDKPLCCATGVCGPDVDPALPRFAADLEWLKQQGHQVERFNLAQQPTAFTENKMVLELVTAQGTDCLPVILVDGRVASRGDYPTRERLQALLEGAAEAARPQSTGLELLAPRASGGDDCCGGAKCC